MDLINKNSISFDEIKSNIEAYIDSLSNSADIKNNIPASNLSLMINLMAGYASYDNLKRVAEANQTYLSSATRTSSIHKTARTFGYNINRVTAPVLYLRYMEVPTITLDYGSVLGKYGDYDLIYWGPTVKFEKLDQIEVCVGLVKTNRNIIPIDMDIVDVKILPIELVGVDNNNILVKVDGVSVPVTKDVESYVVRNQVIDYSDSTTTTTISVSDRTNNYGVSVVDYVDTVWVESDGKLVMDESLLQLNQGFRYVGVGHLGTDGDSDDEIKRLAPLYYSTQRRMVSRLDHKYVIESHPLVKSCFPEIDLGEPEEVKFTIGSVVEGEEFRISITTSLYRYTAKLGDTAETVVNYFLDRIQFQTDVSVIASDSSSITISFDDTMISPIYSVVGNITTEVLNTWTRPRCCTVYAHYVHESSTSLNRVLMTRVEVKMIADFLSVYKMIGYRILFVPATQENHIINLNLGVIGDQYWSYALAEVGKILDEYSMKVNQAFIYGELLAKIGAIILIDPISKERIKVVSHVSPNQVMYDLPSSINKYYTFNSPVLNKVVATTVPNPLNSN